MPTTQHNDEARQHIEHLRLKLAGLNDPALRVGATKSMLMTLAPDEGVAFLTLTSRQAAEHRQVWLCICLALRSEQLVRLVDEVSKTTLEMRRMFSTSTTDSAFPEASKVPAYDPGRPITLGERKTLARTRDRQLLMRVIRDPDPAVIGIVLDNPSLTEDDVVKLCAQRPIARKVLESVFDHLRWVMRPGIRAAMAANPHCPINLSLQLAPTLKLQGLRTVAEAGDLRPALRELCRSLIERRQTQSH